MTTSLTIRTDPGLKDVLTRRAKAQGKTASELAREILAEALAEKPLGERVGHLRGKLQATATSSDAWRASLRARNWRS